MRINALCTRGMAMRIRPNLNTLNAYSQTCTYAHICTPARSENHTFLQMPNPKSYLYGNFLGQILFLKSYLYAPENVIEGLAKKRHRETS